MEAAQEGHVDIVKFLIQRGANVHATTNTGDTALTFACASGHTLIADILLQCGADLVGTSIVLVTTYTLVSISWVGIHLYVCMGRIFEIRDLSVYIISPCPAANNPSPFTFLHTYVEVIFTRLCNGEYFLGMLLVSFYHQVSVYPRNH